MIRCLISPSTHLIAYSYLGYIFCRTVPVNLFLTEFPLKFWEIAESLLPIRYIVYNQIYSDPHVYSNKSIRSLFTNLSSLFILNDVNAHP